MLQHPDQIRSQAPLGLTPHPWISAIKQNQHNYTAWMAYPQDQTTADHTLDHHEELLASYLLYRSATQYNKYIAYYSIK